MDMSFYGYTLFDAERVCFRFENEEALCTHTNITLLL
jgi:hypothetical protein